jgi:hypothetical protein
MSAVVINSIIVLGVVAFFGSLSGSRTQQAIVVPAILLLIVFIMFGLAAFFVELWV